MKILKRLGNLWQSFNSLEGNLFRSGFAFSLLLALAPALTFIVMLFSYGSLDLSPIISALHGFIPEELIDPLITYLTNQNYSATISALIAMGTAIWLASGGVYSFVQISAKREDVKLHSVVVKVKSIWLFLLLMVMILLLLFLLSLTNWDIFALGPLLLFVIFFILYRSLTFEKKEWSYGVYGALISTVATLIFALLFVSILQQFLLASYSVSYGPFASIVLLLLSFYVLSSIIYFGYCVNEEFKKQKSPEEIVYHRSILDELIKKMKKKLND